jgi:hypothetical protein
LLTDEDAWAAYPAARDFYDRAWLAAELGYLNGPAGTTPVDPGRYFVKPVLNLLGMGVGAHSTEYRAGEDFRVPPGSFWSEFFEGEHLSIDYRWDERLARWEPLCCVKGVFDGLHPLCWIVQPLRRRLPVLPTLFSQVAGRCAARRLNVEFIGGKVIECHLRSGLGDWRDAPPGATTAIPVWEGAPVPAGMVRNEDDADGLAQGRRIGFLYSSQRSLPC